MRSLVLAVLTLAASLSSGQAATTPIAPDDLATMKAGIERLRAATLAGDFATIADQMHPRVIAEMGGRDAVLGLIESSYSEMQRAGFRIESMSADPPERAFVAENEIVAIVPMFLSVLSSEARISSSGYLVASRAKEGGAWVFIDGSAIPDRKALELVFPGLPAEVALPEKQQFAQKIDASSTAP